MQTIAVIQSDLSGNVILTRVDTPPQVQGPVYQITLGIGQHIQLTAWDVANLSEAVLADLAKRPTLERLK